MLINPLLTRDFDDKFHLPMIKTILPITGKHFSVFPYLTILKHLLQIYEIILIKEMSVSSVLHTVIY